MKVDELIQRLYSETGILALAARGGTKENLMLLYNYSRKFESSSFEGLYSFINYVNTVIESGAAFQSKKDGEDSDAVSILTVHKSKGLEYPVVFLADAASGLVSPSERKAKIAYSDNYGISIKQRVPGGLAIVESPIYNVIVDSNIERGLEEELRVYYVALTRARERLFVVGAPDTPTKDAFLADAEMKRIHKSSYSLLEAKSFVDILFLVDTNAHVSWEEDESELTDESDKASAPPEISTDVRTQNIRKKEKESTVNSELFSLLSDRFSFEYPEKFLTELPEKMSISNLSPSVLDGNEEEEVLSFDAVEAPKKKRGILPEFVRGSHEKETARRGIATHNFLQFFNLERFVASDVSEELSRLVESNFISEENAKRVRLDEISLFKKSKLLSDMREAKKLYREFRFSVNLPAPLFTQSPEKKELLSDESILLQGVIDCIIEDSDGELHLVDYKTDRLTKDELSDTEAAKKKLSEKHSLQLSYYSRAIEKIFGKAPATVKIYSLPLGDTVDVEPVI